MRFGLISFFFTAYFLLNAQPTTFDIKWLENSIHAYEIESEVRIDSLSFAKIELNTEAKVNNVTILVADTLLRKDFLFKNNPLLSQNVYFETYTSSEKGVNRTGILVFPFVSLGDNRVLKLKQIQVSYQHQATSSRLEQQTVESLPDKSIFAEGEWFRIATTRSGIHRIEYAQLAQLGLPVNSLDPKTIQLYGSTDGMLPQANGIQRNWDPIENAIWVSGEGDGVFNESDFVVFYSPGPDKWLIDSTRKRQNIEVHLYCDTVYYYLTHSQRNGKRVTVDLNTPSSSDPIITSSSVLFHHESELVNVGKFGRKWYGETLEGQTRIFSIPTPNIIENSDVRVEVNAVSTAISSSTYQVFLNKQLLGTRALGGIGVPSSYIDEVGREGSYTNTFKINNSNGAQEVSIAYNKLNNSVAQAYLDYLQVEYLRENIHYSQTGGVFYFSYDVKNSSSSAIQINQLNSNTKVWDITSYFQPIEKTVVNGLVSTDNKIRRHIAFEPSNLFSCILVGKVMNQNLKGLETPDLLIVTNPRFKREADRLAEFRRNTNGMAVEVVELPRIYQEFSSGAQDITAIRDFARYLYLKDGKLKYLLLFGDCSYDYKGRITPNTNFVPVYQARASLSKTQGFSSDDYFGFFDANEGEWSESFANSDRLEIGIGRLPVQTLNQAKEMVDKIIHYSTSQNRFTDWVNTVSFLTDDGDLNSHMTDADKYIVTDILGKNYPNYSVNKLYLNAYPQIATPVGQRSPALLSDLNRAINRGTLILNYTGHGNEIQLASEVLINTQSAREMKNKDRLFLFVTATCDFGRYDDPFGTSGGEAALLNPNGGAIASLTTTRPVYQSSNRLLNQAFFKCVFEKIDGRAPTLGDIIRITKNTSISGVNNRNYALLGDPSLTLNYPKQEILVEKVNGKELKQETDTLKALSRVEIEGYVTNGQNGIDETFSGNMIVKIYDKTKTRFTLAHVEAGINNPSIPFADKGGIINQSNVLVSDGKFKFTFVVPKDISYEFGSGEIVLYAWDIQKTRDAIGYSKRLIIGGSSNDFELDNVPPSVSLFMNDTTFRNEDKVNRNSSLYAKVFDENGINLSFSSVGHEITAVLNENTQEPYILNDYYIADNNSFQRGTIRFPFDSLPFGRNSLTLTVWDTYNNPARSTIFFHVLSGNALDIQNFVLENLAQDGIQNMSFTHNRAGEDLSIELHIHDIQGNRLAEVTAEVNEAPTRVTSISWNYHVQDFSVLSKGLYIYRLIVKSKKDGSVDSEIKKIVIVK